MVAHVVLFTPRRDLTPEQQDHFLRALESACGSIPSILRARVGRRVLMGREYDALAGAGFEYSAVLEFESAEDLRAYLDHPAHDALGRLFYETASAALALDFEMVDGVRARTLRPGA